MAKYRGALPQLGGDFFMTDGGLETTLIFLEGQELPHFAAFLLFRVRCHPLMVAGTPPSQSRVCVVPVLARFALLGVGVESPLVVPATAPA